MQFNLLGGSYEQRYKAANSQKTINWYPVVNTSQAEQNKTQLALYPTPGLISFVTLPGRYSRGFFTVRDHLYTRCFAVVDNTLYEVLNNKSFNTIGVMPAMTIGNSRVWMETNLVDELFIGSYDASYVFNLNTNTLTQITSIAFPNNVTSATYLDQYMIVSANGAVFESLTTSALNWTAIQSYSPTFKSAPVVAVGAVSEQIFNFTTETIEIFINDGTSPYSRLPRTSLLIGIKAKDSLATWTNGFVFLGGSRNGDAIVYSFNGWNPPTPISDQSITQQINKAPTLEDAYGYVQDTKDGHAWYYLTIPSLNTTFVYDFTTSMWHNRQSTKPFQDVNGYTEQSIFRGAFYTNFMGMNLFLDAYSGKVFIEDYNIFTEDSLMIKRERTSQEINNEDKYISWDKMVIDGNVGQATSMGQGSVPVLMVSWSNNGGYSFTEPKTVFLGAQGNHDFRIRVNKLGTGRRRVYKVSVTDPVDVMIQNFYINGTMDEDTGGSK